MSRPAVSVVMAAYNGARLLPETLASLSAQTLEDWELVVVDDCSTDDTRDVLRRWGDPRLRLIEATANGGPVRARNTAVAHARGRHIAGLDQDDVCLPTRLARQVAYLDAHSASVLVASTALILDGEATLLSGNSEPVTPALLGWLLRIGNPLVWSSVMIRGEAARALDPFTRTDRLYAEDFDLYHRLARCGEIARLAEPLLLYRRHPGGASQRYETIMLDSARAVLAEHLADALVDPEAAATLLVTHLMHGRPVRDRATLAALGDVLRQLQDAYLAGARPNPADRQAIRWHTARRWAAVARATLREGTLTFGDALRTRPDHLGLGHAGVEELLLSRAVGRARRWRQTFAE